MKPRRTGRITEYQNNHWFMYVTEWEETDEDQRPHREIEVYYSRSQVVTKEPIAWASTDPGLFDRALAVFMERPETFDEGWPANA